MNTEKEISDAVDYFNYLIDYDVSGTYKQKYTEKIKNDVCEFRIHPLGWSRIILFGRSYVEGFLKFVRGLCCDIQETKSKRIVTYNIISVFMEKNLHDSRVDTINDIITDYFLFPKDYDLLDACSKNFTEDLQPKTGIYDMCKFVSTDNFEMLINYKYKHFIVWLHNNNILWNIYLYKKLYESTYESKIRNDYWGGFTYSE